MSQSGHQWNDTLVPRCSKIVSAFEREWPVSDELARVPSLLFPINGDSVVAHLSPNHFKMGASVELARAAAWGTAAEYEAAAEVWDSILIRQLRTQGLWLREQFAGGAHSGMHIMADACAFMGAVKAGDTDLAIRTRQVLDDTVDAGLAVSTTGGVAVCVGERQSGNPARELFLLTASVRAGLGQQQHGALNTSDPSVWNDDIWVGPRSMRALYNSGTRFATNPSLNGILFRIPIRVERGKGWHYAEDDAGRWVYVDHKQCDRSPKEDGGVRYGDTSNKPRRPSPEERSASRRL